MTQAQNIAELSSDVNSSGVLQVVGGGTGVTTSTGSGNVVLSNSPTLVTPALGVATFSAGTAAAPAITTTGDDNTGIFFPAADTIAFTEGGTESMRVDSSGQLHLGNTVPTDGHTSSSQFFFGVTGNLFSQRTTGLGVPGTYLMENQYIKQSTGDFAYLTTAPTSRIRLSENIISFSNSASGTAGNAVTSTERMRIDSSGNVAIGTSSAYSKFCVTTTNGNFGITGGNTSGGNKIQSFGATTGSNGYLAFEGNSAEYGRFLASGGFSVGTTSDPGAGAIYATGNITAFFSDQRLKTVSGKIENALDKVKSLSGVYYTMNDVAKSHGYDSDETQVGVLAQEVEAVLPEIVKPAPFDLDENNNSKSGENYKTVQYEKLVPLLIEAIKELEAQVAELRSK